MGAIGECNSVTWYIVTSSVIYMIVLYIIEKIMTYHNYTNTTVDTAAAAVNAGTCLEDSNTEDNVFSHIGDAASQVSLAGQSYL